MEFEAEGRHESDWRQRELVRALSICCADKSLLVPFLIDVLADAELSKVSKRLAIAQMILQQKTQMEIVKDLKAGAATVIKVRRWTTGDLATGGLAEVCRRLRDEKGGNH